MSLQYFNLAGKTALITGSARGLGYGFAVGLAGAGARVILNGVNAERLEATTAELREQGHEMLCAAFDVTDEATIVTAIRAW